MKQEIQVAVVGAVAAIVMAFFTGCTPSTGWQVQFGINPINQVDDHKGLKSASFGQMLNGPGAKY